MTAAPAEFRIDVSQAALDDLRLRLRRTRYARPRAVHPQLVAVRTDPRFPHPTIAERAASDIRFYENAPSGGHFLAFEEPSYVAGVLSEFMRSVAPNVGGTRKNP